MDKDTIELDSMMMTMFQVILLLRGDQWTVEKRKNGFMERKKILASTSSKDLKKCGRQITKCLEPEVSCKAGPEDSTPTTITKSQKNASEEKQTSIYITST
jgi:hypothetical protein